LEAWELIPPQASPSVLGAGGLGQPSSTTGLNPKRFYKTELFRGQLADVVMSLDFDDDGRFLLALMRTGSQRFLYRFDAAGIQAPQLLFDTTTLPELAAMVRIEKFQHAVLGRVWAIVDDDIPYTTQILLTDSNNDGTFDPNPIIGDFTLFQSAGLEDYGLWDPLTGPLD